MDIELSDFGQVPDEVLEQVAQMRDAEKKAYLVEREKALVEQSLNDIRDRQAKAMWRMSVWSGKQALEFKFSDWRIDLQENIQAAKSVAIKASNLADELKKDNFNVTFYGGSGTGKTSLALAMISRLRSVGKTAMVVSTAELATMLAESFNEQDAKKKLSSLEKALKEVDVLLLDDFGTEGGLDCRPVRKDLQDYLYKVANARAGVKTTLITTNNSKSELESMYHPKILSRFLTRNTEHQILMKGLEDIRSV